MTDLVWVKRRALTRALASAKNSPSSHAAGLTGVLVLLEAVLIDLYNEVDERELTVAALNERVAELEKTSAPCCVPTIYPPENQLGCAACDD